MSLNKKRADMRKLDDSLYRSKKEVERQAAKLQMVSAASVSQKEAELQDEARSLMVRLKKRMGE
jgi:E3 ubiquitin-protein ligase BRE1